MRNVVAATVAAVAGLIAVGMLGVATAEAPTSTPQRTVSVQGVAIEVIDQSASTAVANAVYRQGMADAVNDGLSKAQFLAGKTGANLGAVQSVAEDGGYISCPEGIEYRGEQPDFGSPSLSVSSGLRAGASRPASALAKPVGNGRKHRKRRKGPAAKKANVATCTLSAQVSLSYALG